jgi:2-polyprenyl-6-hydroxyphenyl methylase/3-demethylubiquinone-9 3-methyltransferase
MTNVQILARYKDINLLESVHMSIRYQRCPFDAIEACVPRKGLILDFGCGHGLLTNLMALESREREVIGLDASEHKIKMARKSVDGQINITFVRGELDDLGPKLFDGVTIIDVLYLLSPQNQVALLQNIRKRLKTDGVLIIKEIPAIKGLNFKVAYLKEVIQVSVLRRTLGEALTYRTEEQWMLLLHQMGYAVKTARLNTRAHSTLFLCRRSP